MCVTRRLIISNNFYNISGLGGGMRSNECHSSLNIKYSSLNI